MTITENEEKIEKTNDKKNKEEHIIFVGSKPPMSYVLAIVTEFKKEIFTSNMAIANLIKEKFPTLSDDHIMNFLSLQISIVVGLYPLTNPSKIQQNAIKNSGFPYTSPCFLTTFTEFLETLLNSYT